MAAKTKKSKKSKTKCKSCGRTDLTIMLNGQCGDCNDHAVINLNLSLVFDVDPDYTSDPRALLEATIDYLQTVVACEENNENLVEHLGIEVRRID